MTRSNVRELIVHLLYQLDHTGENPADAIDTRLTREYYDLLSQENDIYTERPAKKQVDHIRMCVEGVFAHVAELDAIISRHAVGWKLNRISRYIKSAMRLAIYEALYVEDVPLGVAINECVNLSRKYEDEDVVSFVNGILRSFAREAQEQNQ
ncbi:MAG: transcription antitermination factor NusB [Oscillospiraceae bacterium]|nr:transcription antitermination factor NusB [Oscillospiraceae bacterium]